MAVRFHAVLVLLSLNLTAGANDDLWPVWLPRPHRALAFVQAPAPPTPPKRQRLADKFVVLPAGPVSFADLFETFAEQTGLHFVSEYGAKGKFEPPESKRGKKVSLFEAVALADAALHSQGLQILVRHSSFALWPVGEPTGEWVVRPLSDPDDLDDHLPTERVAFELRLKKLAVSYVVTAVQRHCPDVEAAAVVSRVFIQGPAGEIKSIVTEIRRADAKSDVLRLRAHKKK